MVWSSVPAKCSCRGLESKQLVLRAKRKSPHLEHVLDSRLVARDVVRVVFVPLLEQRFPLLARVLPAGQSVPLLQTLGD